MTENKKTMPDQSYRIRIRTIAGLPTVHLFRDDNRPKPLVIYGHGFRSHSRRHIERLYHLAEAGFYAFALDAENHGLRVTPESPAIPTRDDDPWTADLFFNALFKLSDETLACLEEMGRLCDHSADLSRVGAIGVSMGGYLAWHLAARSEMIRVICPLIATPEWKFQDSWSGIGLRPDTTARVKRESPHRDPSLFQNKAVQIHNGTQDLISPIAGSRAFYHRLAAQKDCQAEFHTYFSGHEITGKMLRRSIEFLCEHLQPK